jgi:hypothetical protein
MMADADLLGSETLVAVLVTIVAAGEVAGAL